MNEHRIFVLGNSLLSTSIAGILDQSTAIEIVGSAATAEEALGKMDGAQLDALIVTGTDDKTTVRFCSILARYPDLPIIRADISQNAVQLITSQHIEADPDHLLAAIAALPRRA
jgi:DNA-binding NarL/FixJ family response regulator